MASPLVDLNGAAAAGTATSVPFAEGQATAVIAPAGLVTDADSADFNGGSLTVSFTANGSADDRLRIVTDANVSVGGMGVVSVGGQAVGTLAVASGPTGDTLIVAFNSTNATPAAVTTLVEHIGYWSSDPDASGA